jgi:hypothetical protein
LDGSDRSDALRRCCWFPHNERLEPPSLLEWMKF